MDRGAGSNTEASLKEKTLWAAIDAIELRSVSMANYASSFHLDILVFPWTGSDTVSEEIGIADEAGDTTGPVITS